MTKGRPPINLVDRAWDPAPAPASGSGRQGRLSGRDDAALGDERYGAGTEGFDVDRLPGDPGALVGAAVAGRHERADLVLALLIEPGQYQRPVRGEDVGEGAGVVRRPRGD